MLNRIYQKALKAVILTTIFILATRGWTVVCLNIATNIYFGSKSTWERFFIVSDVATRNDKYGIVTSSFYEVAKEPMSAVTLDIEECGMNKCSPDIVVSADRLFMERALKTFPPRKISDKLALRAITAGGSLSEDKTTISFYVWGDRLYAAIPKNSQHHKYASLLLKDIILDELYRQYLPREKILRALQEKEAQSQKKIKTLQQQYSRKNDGDK